MGALDFIVAAEQLNLPKNNPSSHQRCFLRVPEKGTERAFQWSVPES